MADNIDVKDGLGVAAKLASKDVGSLVHATKHILVNTDGTTAINPATETSLAAILASITGMVNIAGKQTFTRPADTTAYSVGDLIANSTTAGSVTRMSFTGATIAGGAGEGTITSFWLGKSTAAVAQIRAHFLKTDHAVTNGDNAAFVLTSLNADNYIGFADVNLSDTGFAGGAFGVADVSIDYQLASGDTIYVLLEALAAFTPGNAEVFTAFPKFRRYS